MVVFGPDTLNHLNIHIMQQERNVDACVCVRVCACACECVCACEFVCACEWRRVWVNEREIKRERAGEWDPLIFKGIWIVDFTDKKFSIKL